jgi:hypothetical protein
LVEQQRSGERIKQLLRLGEFDVQDKKPVETGVLHPIQRVFNTFSVLGCEL